MCYVKYMCVRFIGVCAGESSIDVYSALGAGMFSYVFHVCNDAVTGLWFGHISFGLDSWGYPS